MADQSSSDPLPYVQVDRVVLPAASLLAGQLGVTVQHAIGSLVQWWQLCGDPRELERIIEATPANEDPEVLLAPGEAVRRLCLAAGRPVGSVECASLEALGLVEARGERVRVRGMSRFFEPLARRLQARKAAVKGGQKSAEVRREKAGTAQPRRSGHASEAAQAGLEATPEPTLEANAEARPEPTTEAPPNTAGSGHLTTTTPLPPFAGAKGGVKERAEQQLRKRLEALLEKPPAKLTRQDRKDLEWLASQPPLQEVDPSIPDGPEGEAWGNILATLEDEGKSYAASWLCRVQPTALRDGVLELTCPDEFFRGWVTEHYSGLLDDLAPNGVKVRFIARAA